MGTARCLYVTLLFGWKCSVPSIFVKVLCLQGGKTNKRDMNFRRKLVKLTNVLPIGSSTLALFFANCCSHCFFLSHVAISFLATINK